MISLKLYIHCVNSLETKAAPKVGKMAGPRVQMRVDLMAGPKAERRAGIIDTNKKLEQNQMIFCKI